MIGIELDRPCTDLVRAALAEKLLINVTNDTVVRLLPPLIMKREEAELLTQTLARLIRNFLS
jgi:acetylornithine aminotransferase